MVVPAGCRPRPGRRAAPGGPVGLQDQHASGGSRIGGDPYPHGLGGPRTWPIRRGPGAWPRRNFWQVC